MTVGVWMVPFVLLAGVVLLWSSAWFEGIVAPQNRNPRLSALDKIDTAFVDTAADRTSPGMDGELPAEPALPAA